MYDMIHAILMTGQIKIFIVIFYWLESTKRWGDWVSDNEYY